MSNPNLLKQFKSVINAALPLDQDKGILDEKIIDSIIETFSKLPMYSEITDEDVKKVRAEIHTNYEIRLSKGVALISKQHKKWFVTRKPTIDLKYWNRFEQYLQNDKDFSRTVVSKMDEVSDEIVDLLGDPSGKKEEQRRGLIIGDVQSGKTLTYSGIICKAVDAGYRTVILLTGTSNDLRRQTQIRLDEAFIGMDSASVGKKDRLVFTGVGKYDPSLSPQAVTTTERDFSKVVSRSLVTRLNTTAEGHPMLFVIKKNASVLKHLTEWIRALNQVDDNKIDNAILLIDDEADYASINTKVPEDDPTRTNQDIVGLLNNFRFASYVGFTATPYANIFIDPKSNEEMEHENLFPGDYIYALEAPSNYIGAQSIFPEGAPYRKTLRDINDGEDFYPLKHKNGDNFGHISESLENAINTFLLSNVIRDLRGDADSHRSMMVNVSRFVATQNQLRDAIDIYLSEVRTSINNYASLPAEKAVKDEHILKLLKVYEEEYRELFSWEEIQANLLKSVAPIMVFSINQGSKKLNYDEYADGLRVIAIGGQALSRGLTLEGLTVSYLYRNSKAYDTLMQMGRWFGYRKNYDDICRVWMDADSQSWYRSISEATNELRSEIKRMRDKNATPLEFGLRVRNDREVPLIVTARNKMRGAARQVVSSSLSSDIIETPYLNNDPSINQHNLTAIRALLAQVEVNQDSRGRLGSSSVDASEIIDLLSNIDVPGNNVYFDPKSVAKFIREYAGNELRKWDVLLASGTGREFKLTDDINIAGIIRSYDLKNENKFIRVGKASTRLGSPSDPQYGLDEKQIDLVKEDYRRNGPLGAKTIPSKLYFSELLQNRNPLLVLYFLDLKDTDEKTKDFGNNPIAGFGIGIPFLTDEKTKYIDYQTNTIYQALGATEDESDEEV